MHRIAPVLAAAALPAAALAGTTTVFDADFEAFTLGAPSPTGPAADRPVSIEPTVDAAIESAATVAGPALSSGQFLRAVELTAPEAPSFRFDRGLGFDSGQVNIAFDLLLETEEEYRIGFRPTGSSAGSLLNILISEDVLRFQTGAGSELLFITIGEALRFEIDIDLDTQLVNASINGDSVVTDLATNNNEFGRINFGFAFSDNDPARATGAFQLDNLFVTQVPTPATAGLFTAAGLVAARRRRA